MKILTFNECADLANQEPQNYLVDQFIPYPGRILLIAPSKKGKSFLGMQLGLAVAKGESFMGRKSTSSRVLYLQYDTPPKIWLKRMADVRKYGLTGHSNFITLDHREPDYRKRIDIRKNPSDVLYLKEVVEQIQPKLVIIDTLRKMFSGDENSSDVAQEVFNNLNEIFEHQSVVYIHHTHKLSPPPGQKIQAPVSPGDAVRGSSFFAGEVDATYLIFGNKLISESRIDEPIEEKMEFDKITLQWKFQGNEKLIRQEKQVRDLWKSKSWGSWMEFRKHVLHTLVTIPDHLMSRLEHELVPVPSGEGGILRSEENES